MSPAETSKIMTNLALLLRKNPCLSGFIHVKSQKNEQFPHLHAQWNSPWEFPWFWLVLRPTKKAVLDPVRNYSEIEPLTSAKLKKNIEKARKSTQNPWKSTQKSSNAKSNPRIPSVFRPFLPTSGSPPGSARTPQTMASRSPGWRHWGRHLGKFYGIRPSKWGYEWEFWKRFHGIFRIFRWKLWWFMVISTAWEVWWV